MVAFESEGRLHFEDNGGTVAVRRAKLGDQVIIMMTSHKVLHFHWAIFHHHQNHCHHDLFREFGLVWHRFLGGTMRLNIGLTLGKGHLGENYDGDDQCRYDGADASVDMLC